MRPIAHATLAILASLVLAAMLAMATDARAGASYTSPYTYEQTYGTALRLIRVDLDLKITEKDPELGYVLFEYQSPESGKRVSNGSLEVVRARDTVHVSVQLPQMPSYHEQMIVDALAKKLASEHGEPPRRKHDSQPAPPPPDGGAPDGDAGAGTGTN